LHGRFSSIRTIFCTHATVDFVLENRLGKLTGIEVKASGSVDSKDLKGLRHRKETEPQAFQRGVVLYSGREIVPFGADLFAVPLSMWWSLQEK
jgi:predicted AAA+ superfamily ATPase